MDGEVDAELHREIAEHLKRCTQCRDELEVLSGVDLLLRGLPQHELSADFAKDVAARAQHIVARKQSVSYHHRAWNALLGYAERFLELLDPEARGGTRSLDEFSDIPASFIGYAYFKALGLNR
jgi:anti-sigma factor RsiW